MEEKDFIPRDALVEFLRAAMFTNEAIMAERGDLRVICDGKRRLIRIANTNVATVHMGVINRIFEQLFFGYEEADLRIYSTLIGVEFVVELKEKKQ